MSIFDGRYNRNEDLSLALVNGVDQSTHLSNYDFRPRRKGMEIGPASSFWAKHYETDKMKAVKAERNYAALFFNADSQYVDGYDKPCGMRHPEVEKHIGPVWNLKEKFESKRIFNSIKSNSLLDPKPVPSNQMLHFPEWKSNEPEKWVSNNRFKIVDYISLNNSRIGSACAVKRSAWNVIKVATSQIDENPYQDPLPDELAFRDLDHSKNIDKKRLFHNYSCGDIIGKNIHVSNSIRTNTMDIVISGKDGVAVAKMDEYETNLTNNKKSFRKIVEDPRAKKAGSAKLCVSTDSGKFEAKDIGVSLDQRRNRRVTTESEKGSPLKSRAKISMVVPPGMGVHDCSKSKSIEAGDGEPGVGRPMFEIPYSNKTRCVLPDSPKVWPKSKYKEHYGAYKEELANQEKLERKYQGRHQDWLMATGENDNLENGWHKAVSEMESPAKRSRRANLGDNGYNPSEGFSIKAEKISHFKRGLKGGLKSSQSSDDPEFEKKTQETIEKMFAKKSNKLKPGPTLNLMRGSSGKRKSTIHEEPETPNSGMGKSLRNSILVGHPSGYIETPANLGGKNLIRNIFKSKQPTDQQGILFFVNPKQELKEVEARQLRDLVKSVVSHTQEDEEEFAGFSTYKAMKNKRDIALGSEQIIKPLRNSPEGYSPTKARGSSKLVVSNPRMPSTVLGGSGLSKSKMSIPGNFLVNLV
jgi:hypothetical protein